MRINKAIKSSGGFTFIELLVVVTIVAVLTGVGAVSFQSTNLKARDTKRRSDLEQIRSALELCRADSGSYPLDISNGVVCGSNTYLSPLPKDPKSTVAGFGYQYTYVSATQYNLCALKLEAAGEVSPYCVTNP